MATGPQGVQGIQGQQGVQGIRGMTGAQGVQGPHGGPTGPAGADSTVTGPTGPAGSGGAGSGPDIPPATANAADDEFDVGSTLDTGGTRRSGATAWTSALTNAVASLSNGRLLITTLSATSLEFVWQPVSGSDWMYTSQLAFSTYDSNISYAGMVITDSTGANRLALIKTLDTTPKFQTITNSTFDTIPGTYDDFSTFGPGYFQVEYRTFGVGSVGLIGRYSTNGTLFTTRMAKSPTWTPARIGYIIGVSGTATLGAQLTSDWFRRNIGYTPITSLPVAIVTTTGTVTVSGNIYTFTGNGTFKIDGAPAVIDTLVIGGGGGGSTGFFGGGGGGGGVLYATGVTVATGTYTVTVGAGGVMSAGGYSGTSGSSSSFLTYTALGGGRGGYTWNGSILPEAGGCGGGGGFSGQTGAAGSQGGNGANGVTTGDRHGGGGGGGGGNGILRAGGAGIANSITGTSVLYAGGGGGGFEGAYTAPGGSGGGGAGGDPPVAGTANKGGGGGGSSRPESLGAAGGSGVVIIRVV